MTRHATYIKHLVKSFRNIKQSLTAGPWLGYKGNEYFKAFDGTRLFQKYLPLYCFSFIGLRSKKPDEAFKEEIAEKRGDWALEKDLNKYISSAEIAIHDGNLKKAEQILNQALVHHEGSKTVGVTCVYDMLATVAYRDGDIERSKEMLEKVINYMSSTGLPPDHNKVVSFRLKLARVLSKLGKTNEAERNFRQCLEIQKLKHQVGLKDEEEDKLRINCLFWYGRHLIKTSKFQEAQYCFDTAYTLAARLKSFQNSQVMVILYNLSEAQLGSGEKDAALKNLLSAVMIGRSLDHPDLPLYQTRLGTLYLHKGLLQEAKHWCEAGREGARRAEGGAALREGEECLRRINEALKLGPLKV